jgi:hypothetical protein
VSMYSKKVVSVRKRRPLIAPESSAALCSVLKCDQEFFFLFCLSSVDDNDMRIDSLQHFSTAL